MNERIQEIRERIAKARKHGVISQCDLSDIEYLLAERDRYREALIAIREFTKGVEIPPEKHIDDIAQSALREEEK